VAEESRRRVLIADDHPATRLGVRRALEEGGFEVCGEAADAPATVESARDQRPDVVLLDIHMPGNGITAAAEISTSLPDTAVVILTVSRDDDDLFDALRAGAVGYLLKGMDPKRLPDALRGVLEGEAALPRALVGRLVNEFRERGGRRLPLTGKRSARLSSREWQVLEFLAEGLTTAEIAERMFVTSVTIRTHVSAILKKLQVPDRAAAIRFFKET
jgi:DNA-binding NarL/FixJ family response regulator